MTIRLLLDTSSLTYRAFFALPTSITDSAGKPVNAVRGYLDMTAHLTTELAPDEVVHCYDHDWRPAPRVAAYAGYKSQRAEDPPDLPPQFDLLREVLDAAGAVQAEAPGWEADDAIGALCAAAGPDDRVAVVTGDRDLIQLVRDPVVRVLFTVKGVKTLATFDEAGVFAKYGLPASRYVDFATLRGDPSDGLPGVKGIGEKTARDLVTAYRSLDAICAAVDGLPARAAAGIRDATDYLAAMQQVVPVRCDVDVEVRHPHADDARLDLLAQRHNLESPVGRLRAAMAR